MKRVFLLITLAVAVLASCKKIEAGGTATQALAGEWVVMIDAVDANGEIAFEDPYGVGSDTRVWTYNTAANVSNKMFLTDVEVGEDYCFWEYKVELDCDADALTFGGTSTDLINDIQVAVTGGKITLNGEKTPSGMPADKIEFYVVFEDDDYAGALYDRLYVHGYRYTGFDADGL